MSSFNKETREEVIESLMDGVKKRLKILQPLCSRDGVSQGGVCSGTF